MSMGEVVELIERFAKIADAPVRTGTNVTSVRRTDDGYDVTTSRGEIRCRTLVIASGACNVPTVPGFSDAVPASIEQLTTFDYRSPDQLRDGGVLVVGASATGVQLAAEIRRSGRPVTLSVGEHVRLPRTYRGRDVLWWMDASGRVERAVRRGRRPHPRPAAALAAAGRDPRAGHARPERPHGPGRRARGPLGDRPRRDRVVLRRAAQRVLARGPQDAAPAGHLRRLGARAGARRRARPARAARADAGARVDALAARPGQRRDQLGPLGDRLPARLHLAGGAGARREGSPAPRGRRGRQPGPLRPRAARCCDAASRPSSTASRTTPAR